MFIVAAHNPSPSPQVHPWWSTMVKCLVFGRDRIRFLAYGPADLIMYFMASLSHTRQIFVMARHTKRGYNRFLPYFFPIHLCVFQIQCCSLQIIDEGERAYVFKCPPEHICSLLASLSQMTTRVIHTTVERRTRKTTGTRFKRESNPWLVLEWYDTVTSQNAETLLWVRD